MIDRLHSRCSIYRELDNIVGRTSSVIFGNGAIAEVPLSELINVFGLNISACNRSIPQLCITEAARYLDECVLKLDPDKVFLCFEDNGEQPALDTKAFTEAYADLIVKLNTVCSCRIYILSPLSSDQNTTELNDSLRELARKYSCEYIDISDCSLGAPSMLRLFKTLIHHMRDSRISFTEAIQLASI